MFSCLLLLSSRTNAILKPHVTGYAERLSARPCPPKTHCQIIRTTRQGRFSLTTKL